MTHVGNLVVERTLNFLRVDELESPMGADERYLVFCKNSVDREIVRVHPDARATKNKFKW